MSDSHWGELRSDHSNPAPWGSRGAYETRTHIPEDSVKPREANHSFSRPLRQGGGSKVRLVEIHSLALIKILKHCRDHFPTPVNGQLLGLDVDDRLEVTNCFPLQNKRDLFPQLLKEKVDPKDIDEKIQQQFDKYQVRMVDLMYEVNGDCFSVGWYQTMSFGDLKDMEIMDSLCVYQASVDKAVAIGFDPLLNSMGKCAFKAYRVTDEFIRAHREEAEEHDISAYNRLVGKDVLVEIPIVIKNPALIEAYLLDWASQEKHLKTTGFHHFDLDQGNYIERSLICISDCLEELFLEQDRLMRFQRDSMRLHLQTKAFVENRKIENDQRRLRGEAPLPAEPDSPAYRKIEQPSQLPTLLMSNQVSSLSRELSNVCMESLSKTYLLSRSASKSKI